MMIVADVRWQNI